MKGDTRFSERFWMSTSIILALTLIVVQGAGLVDAREQSSNDAELFEELKVFTDIVSIVQDEYVKSTDSKLLVTGAIKGMLMALDPHSGYLEPAYFQDLQAQTKGEFGGLGIEITMRDGLLVVVTPMQDSPAEKAGVKPGDVIVKIQGDYTKQQPLVDIVKKLRGPRGEAVMLSILRPGEEELREIKVIRDKIKIHSTKSKYLGDGYGYVRINQFMETSGDDLEAAIASFRDEAGEISGLILDLRNNPGGLLTQAIRVSDLFLKSGVIVYTDGRVQSQKQEYFAHSAGTEPDYPVVVLVNGGSASASEIVAGALKDHGRALILGTQTFGKGSVQTINPLDNGGALQLTTALYYTKSGRSLQATGVVPDIIIEQEEEHTEEAAREEEKHVRRMLREKDLPGAFQNPHSNKKSTKGEKYRKISDPDQFDELLKWLQGDTQLQRAVELLKTFNRFSSEERKSVSLQSAKKAKRKNIL